MTADVRALVDLERRERLRQGTIRLETLLSGVWSVLERGYGLVAEARRDREFFELEGGILDSVEADDWARLSGVAAFEDTVSEYLGDEVGVSFLRTADAKLVGAVIPDEEPVDD